jgi:large subunit ribosomal protein L11
MGKETVEVLVEGGKATPAPPLGPSLSQLKINVGEVVAKINEKTSSFKGMEVPVKVIVDTSKKSYEIEVGSPPVTSMLKKEMNKKTLLKITEESREEPGSIPLSKIIEITKGKEDSMLGRDFKSKVKQVLGTCLSSGVKVDDKDPRDVMKEIYEGKIKVD